jgi:hypothetical protein
MFLSESELVELTGYRQASKQVAQLRQQRIPHHLNRAGHPRVARAILEGGKVAAPKPTANWSPSWAASQP